MFRDYTWLKVTKKKGLKGKKQTKKVTFNQCLSSDQCDKNLQKYKSIQRNGSQTQLRFISLWQVSFTFTINWRFYLIKYKPKKKKKKKKKSYFSLSLYVLTLMKKSILKLWLTELMISSGTNCPPAAISARWFQYKHNYTKLSAINVRSCFKFLQNH